MRPVNTFDAEDTTIGSFNCIEITGLPMLRILFTILLMIRKLSFWGKIALLLIVLAHTKVIAISNGASTCRLKPWK